MRNWKNWLFPILTVLTVTALALLPLRLSTLEDGELTGTVHAEPLTADNNFPSKPPELPGRVWLLAQYQSMPETLTIVGQDPEWDKLEELSIQAREELEKLVELDILPEESGIYDEVFSGGLLYLRDQTDLSSAAFSYLSAYSKQNGESLLLYLDGESGQILGLEMVSRLIWDSPVTANATGKAFLKKLGLNYEPLNNAEYGMAVFRLESSKSLCLVHRDNNLLGISFQVDWETVDDGIRAAMGYPPDSSTGVDAGVMQNW